MCFGLIFLVILVSVEKIYSQDKILASVMVRDYGLQTVNDYAKEFVILRVADIEEDFFRYEFFQENEDLILLFVKYNIVKNGKVDIEDSELILRKKETDGKKILEIIFFGERGQFLEYCDEYGFDYEKTIKLYKVSDGF